MLLRSLLNLPSLFLITLRSVFIRPIRIQEGIHACYTQGVQSLPIIATSTAFAGFVVVQEMAWHMDRALNTVQMIPGFTGQFIFRELGIAIPALLLVAKVGASTTAEIATMKVTDQLDALKLLGVNAVNYLVVPRFLASVLCTACLTLIAVFITLTCAGLVAVMKFGFIPSEFVQALSYTLKWKDLACALTKGVVFGSIIPIVSCSFGFECEGGAEGVGTATTQSVVTSTCLVIFFDFVLTTLFSL